jgi:threonine synthase
MIKQQEAAFFVLSNEIVSVDGNFDTVFRGVYEALHLG